MRFQRPIILAAVLGLALGLAAAARAGDAATAALQVALRAQGLYASSVDGVYGPATRAAVAAFQVRAGLPPTGELGPATTLALGPRPALGSRLLARGASGWDVTELQFLLAEHGFPSASFGAVFDAHVDGALRRFEAFAGLAPDGVAGPAVVAALQAPPPAPPAGLAWPLAAPVGDGFGPRGDRFHAGIDLLAAAGTPVGAAGPGRVVYAGWRDGFGYEVTVADGAGLRAIYAHLSEIDVPLGERVAAGAQLGRVGMTGDATGPHLHFELRVRGAAVDPLPALPPPAAVYPPAAIEAALPAQS